MPVLFQLLFSKSRLCTWLVFFLYLFVVTFVSYLGFQKVEAEGIELQIQIVWDVIRERGFLLKLVPFLYLAPVVIWLFHQNLISKIHVSKILGDLGGRISQRIFHFLIFVPTLFLDIALHSYGIGTCLVAISVWLYGRLNQTLQKPGLQYALNAIFIMLSAALVLSFANLRRQLLNQQDVQAGFDTLRTIGTVDVVYLSISVALIVIAVFSLTRLTAILAVSWCIYIVPAHNLEHTTELEKLPAEFANQQSLSGNGVAFVNWVKSRPDLQKYADTGKFYPVFFVASEGGGGYAAAHSYMFLKSLERQINAENKETEIDFSDHIFALTGASGGAVGSALYWSNTYGEQSNAANCKLEQQFRFFETDFLTPVIASLLLDEFPRRILKIDQSEGSGRFKTLKRQLQLGDSCISGLSAINYFEHFWNYKTDGNGKGTWEVSGNAALMPITTDVANGQTYTFSPFEIPHPISGRSSTTGYYHDFRWGPVSAGNRGVFIPQKNRDISLASAVTASAAFPFVSPSLKLPVPPAKPHYCKNDQHPACKYSPKNPAEPPQRYGANLLDENNALLGSRLLVDGGYSDNSGGSILFAIEAALKKSGVGVNSQNSGEPFKLPENRNLCDVELVAVPDNYPSNQRHFPWSRDGRCRIPVVVSYIMIGAEWERPNNLPVSKWHRPKIQSFLFDPLNTVLGVRNSISIKSRDDFRHAVCPNSSTGNLRCETGTSADRTKLMSSLIDVVENKLPLGWHLSQPNIEKLRQAATVSDCKTNNNTRACQSMHTIRQLLQP